MILTKREKRIRRRGRVRAKVSGTAGIPRVSVFRSNRHIYAQVIDDTMGRTLISGRDLAASSSTPAAKKSDRASLVGVTLAKKMIESGFEKIVFDRSGFKYHGRVKALAEGLRKGGLKF